MVAQVMSSWANTGIMTLNMVEQVCSWVNAQVTFNRVAQVTYSWGNR